MKCPAWFRFIVLPTILGVGFDGFAQTIPYPTRPVRLIVPFTTGGATDILARTIGQRLSEQVGQPVVVDNRGGAGGNIGAELVAKSPPDGYTALFSTSGILVVNPSLYRKLPFDPVRDFAPVAMLASHGNLLVVHPSMPVKSVTDLIALAKQKPGQLNYGSGGKGTSPHLAAELFKVMSGTDIVHVPYKSGGPAAIALLAGEVQVMFASIPEAIRFVREGRLRALAITSTKRSNVTPDIPTVAEAGLPGYEVNIWLGVLVPAGTAREIIAKLNDTIVKALNAPDVSERLAREGFEPVGTSPQEFAQRIAAELPVWAKVVQAAKLGAD